ncbi:hypothetical protein ASPZODRAFT_161911 [Penicilliopsis zonata CBS 506.65]|uniref:Uncharacterized protein n=1 Tax=Penicilliopsis zonata CBS 506.65 TaxID=1073090 RepID=A0A1L9S6Y2_9EURO|nr:hypothetical protein ASPZODRAFT_161911 [Penicilliopsis zonata CBS 506.65]OJJ42911.1 hypothetical protein ASPZODRAFT_161911 [Penicilliopsis zonata CBS 506.65]
MSAQSPSATSKEILLVSPVSPITGTLSAGMKRKIVPSLESAQSRKITIIAPEGIFASEDRISINASPIFAAARRLFPTGEAYIEQRVSLKASHAHPDPSPPWRTHVDVPPSRDIVLPFDLTRNPEAYSNPENQELLMQVFRDCIALSFGRGILIFQLLALPPRPWPQKIAGAPCYLTDVEFDWGPVAPLDRRSMSRIFLEDNEDYRDDSSKANTLFDHLISWFEEAEISITELMYWDNQVVIVLEDERTDLTKVPKSIACCLCYYLLESEMHRPRHVSALRRVDIPVEGGIDDSAYCPLRPGVMLGSGGMLTSSGVLVKDRLGNQYLTVASHGLPEGAKVLQPSNEGREIGELVMEIPHTDVGLVKLHDGENYINETFENTLKLRQFKREREIRGGDPIAMNTPFTGYMEGVAGLPGRIRMQANDNPFKPRRPWVPCRWDYFGQNSHHHLNNGMCGSPIYDQEGRVVSFFRYAPKSGYFLDYVWSISAEVLLEKGYTVV